MFDLHLLALLLVFGVVLSTSYYLYRQLKIHEREIIHNKNEIIRIKNIFNSNTLGDDYDSDVDTRSYSTHHQESDNEDNEDNNENNQQIINQMKSHRESDPSLIEPVVDNVMLSKNFTIPVSSMFNNITPLMNQLFNNNNNAEIKEVDDNDDDDNDNNDNNSDNDSDDSDDSDDDSESDDDSNDSDDSDDDDNEYENDDSKKTSELEDNNVKEKEEEEKDEVVLIEDLDVCNVTIKNGKRTGQPCGKPIKEGGKTCYQHKK